MLAFIHFKIRDQWHFETPSFPNFNNLAVEEVEEFGNSPPSSLLRPLCGIYQCHCNKTAWQHDATTAMCAYLLSCVDQRKYKKKGHFKKMFALQSFHRGEKWYVHRCSCKKVFCVSKHSLKLVVEIPRDGLVHEESRTGQKGTNWA